MTRYDAPLLRAISARSRLRVRLILPFTLPTRNVTNSRHFWINVRIKETIEWALYELMRASVPEAATLPSFAELLTMSDEERGLHLERMSRAVSTFIARADGPLTMEISTSKLLSMDCKLSGYYKTIRLKMPTLSRLQRALTDSG